MVAAKSLGVRISLVLALFVAVLVGGLTLLVGLRIRSDVRVLALADNRQIAQARAQEISQMLAKLQWQMKMIALRDDIRSADPAVIPRVVGSLDGLISSEVVGLFFAWPDGSYISSIGARGNIAERDYFSDFILCVL